MKIYTKQGDKGKTSIIGGRLPKHDSQIELLGTIDELNSFVGLARAELAYPELEHELLKIQHELFDCGSDLSYIQLDNNQDKKLTDEETSWLEKRVDDWMDKTPPIKRFILPGGSKAASTLHICRTMARKAERQLTKCLDEKGVANPIIQQYLNRLSDYFFVAARAANAHHSTSDIEYIRGADVFRFYEKEE
ncbi:cob(I)yrinic acid a,c-diamide adenosyltransferase [Alkalicoccobacillus gibsonii]|jgi:cob(I)alamin adenosyltransferase|uniref:cob(I)yrinic acid a,c-diamide adenosyltransferase n=1 Tax=Alkalicoccobacillus gibsonii TaxID=79881 RepID=UPI001934902F|nr:cob(I)yrinic acid a,c-diamide adenosyltransferase [Alkalicoccobacillus gibsonii]MBM0064593.1 cob(I)yrinic acid a,c-diamide adenosyltransferase [Alkalicoccobacillus gibsonii]